MEIVGNGVDIIKNSRIKNLIKNHKFLSRIFSENEIQDSKKVKNKTNFFAKRFAAKEAFVKALGTGFRKGINFSDISVVNDKVGKPLIKINDKIKSIILKKNKFKSFKIFLSLSDQDKHSIAFVILSGLKE
jgi:holo-[acyl-carrier protein] synthase